MPPQNTLFSRISATFADCTAINVHASVANTSERSKRRRNKLVSFVRFYVWRKKKQQPEINSINIAGASV